MRFIYLGSAAEESDLQYIYAPLAKKKTVYVQQKWDYAFCKALERESNYRLTVVSYPPIPTFPAGKKILVKRQKVSGLQSGKYLPAFNLPVIKQVFSVLSAYNAIRKELANNNDQFVVFTHTLYLQSLLAIKMLNSNMRKRVKLLSLVPDLPEYSTSEKISNGRMFRKLFGLYKKASINLKGSVDGYICFSEAQMEHLDRTKSHIVMEGYVDINAIDKVAPARLETQNKVFMYAGNMKPDSGVDLLVSSFEKADIPNTELWVCGDGELRPSLEKRCCKNVRYLGVLPREQVLAIEKSVYALINPRPTSEEYAKYSFPSKLLEYLATGTPVISTRIPSLGKEYGQHILFFDDYSMDAFIQKMNMIVSMNLGDIGVEAKMFIKENKSVESQAKRVIKYAELS